MGKKGKKGRGGGGGGGGGDGPPQGPSQSQQGPSQPQPPAQQQRQQQPPQRADQPQSPSQPMPGPPSYPQGPRGPPPGMARGQGAPPGVATGPPRGRGRGQYMQQSSSPVTSPTSPEQPSFWAQRPQRPQGPQQQYRQGPPQQYPQLPQQQQPRGQQSRAQHPQQPRAQPPPQQQYPRQPQPHEQSPQPSPPHQPSPPAQHETKVEKMAEGVKDISTSFTVPKRKPQKDGDKKGKPIVVETNHLEISIKNPNMMVFHYDVAIEPERPFRFYRPAMKAIQQKCYPNRWPAFDGRKNLYSYPELPLKTRELKETVHVFDDERQCDKEVTVTIKLASTVDMSVIKDYLRGGSSMSTPQDAIQALDIVLRQPAANRFVTVGRSFFTPPPGRVISLGDGMDLWYGFFQSAIVGWKPYLNIDVAHKGFPAPAQCIEILSELARGDLQRIDSYTERAFLEAVKGLKVVCEIPQNNVKRVYKVLGLSECAQRNMFTMENKDTKATQEISVERYYFNVYRYKLKYPTIPCLKVGTISRPISVPLELCRIQEGQVTMRKLNELQTRNMIKEAAVDTDRRKEKIYKSMREIGFNKDPCMKEFGLSVAESFTKVPARILRPPTVDYRDKNNREVQVRVDKGVWKIMNTKFLSGADAGKWRILNANKRIRDSEVRVLADGLYQNGQEVGITIPPVEETVNIDHQAKISEYFRRCEKDGVKLLVIILPDRGVTYAQVKKMAELQVGVLTQCVKSATVQRRLNTATFVNILQKINAKLNGINHNITRDLWPRFFQRPVMVVGADVTHPAPGQLNVPSIAAVAASHDPKAFKYNMIWKLQPPRVEVISDLENIMKEHLLFFYKKNQSMKPEKILFYRDGVSEGQFRSVLDVELRSIRQACNKLESTYRPSITFLVVQKRHHTRFFPGPQDADGRNKNVPAGTIVDTNITHPTELDFYLVSHASIQGTARPTKYHLLWDDSDMSEQELEEITYYLCHLFARCTRSVSYPAPTYYAHLAAFRARSYTETDGGVVLNLDDLKSEQSRREIKPAIRINNPMFFV